MWSGARAETSRMIAASWSAFVRSSGSWVPDAANDWFTTQANGSIPTRRRSSWRRAASWTGVHGRAMEPQQDGPQQAPASGLTARMNAPMILPSRAAFSSAGRAVTLSAQHAEPSRSENR